MRENIQNPIENGCKPSGHYTKAASASMLGISRPTLDKRIRAGFIREFYHKPSDSMKIKGTEIIRYYNSI